MLRRILAITAHVVLLSSSAVLAQAPPHLWSQRFGDSVGQSVRGVAVDGSGNVILTGYFEGTVDFGGGALTSAGSDDIFVVKFGFGAVPTLLRSFVAGRTESGIEVGWVMSEPATGIDFHVLRKSTMDAEYLDLDTSSINRQDCSFTFVDSRCETGLSYVYRVDASDATDRWTLFETNPVAAPSSSFALYQNFPNPFNPSTVVTYGLADPGRVSLTIHDAAGRLVRTLIDEQYVPQARVFSVTWDGRDNTGTLAASGVYFYRLTAGKQMLTKKMVLLK